MKQIIKNFNNLVKKTIFKVKNKTNDNFNISNFNKFLIIFIGSLFLYIFYLLTPLLYDKTWIQANIESKLLNEFKINLSTSADISYLILPKPHFLIKDSKLLLNTPEKQKPIAEIKYVKIFLNQGNFFDKEKMNIQKVLINEANFSLLTKDLKLLKNFRSKKFSNKKINIINSNIFLKDSLDEIISIIKIKKAISFFDNKKLLNFIDLKGEVFNVPFTFNLTNQDINNKFEKINFNSKLLKLDISNKSIQEKNKLITGENNVSLFNHKINTKYNIKDELIIFESVNTKLNNSQVSYSGEILTDPFSLDLNIYLDNHKISKLFDTNDILIELIKSGLIFNENISLNTSINITSNAKNMLFNKGKVNFQIINGEINFNKTQFVNDDIGSLKLLNSSLFFKNNKLAFNGDLLIDIKDSQKLFSFLNTSKLLRKNFKSIFINLDYDFLSNQIKFNNIKIDNNNIDKKIIEILDDFNHNDFKNFNKSRRLINSLLRDYVG